MQKRKKDKIIIGTEVLLLCMTLGVLRINAVGNNPPSSEVNYNKNSQINVQNSINDLYNKVAYGDAASNEIASGKTALVGGKQVVGTYTCPSLASQTPGDATPEDITEGKIAWVNGNRIVGVRTTLADKLKLGDYISYTPSKTVYYGRMSPSSGGSISINPSLLKLWRVIRKNADGTVDVVSEDLSEEGITLGGSNKEQQAYKYYIWILNDLASAYETKGYTVGSRAMGYDSTKAKEIVNSSEPDDGYKTDYELVKAIGSLRANRHGYSSSDGASYYLASRGGGFYVYYINNCGSTTPGTDGLDANFRVCVSHSYKTGLGIRPIVVLKSDLKITGGDGTASSPYTLGL